MQRVLHIVGKMDRAGAETMIMNLYRHIDRSKVQFDFITFSNTEGDFDKEIKLLGGKIYSIDNNNPLLRLLALYRFFKKNKEYKIVHSHTLLNSGLNLLIAFFAGLTTRIAHAHSTNRLNKGVINNLYKLLNIFLINNFANIKIACGIEARNFLFPKAKNVIILLNSIDLNLYNEIGLKNKDYLDNEFELDSDTLKIVQIGRLEEVKNHLLTIQIANALKEKAIKFKVFFVGQGHMWPFLKELVSKHKLEDCILFLGLRTDIPYIMSSADVMLMPSLHEGFPVVLVESQAVGLRAVVSSSISSEVDLGLGLVDFVNLNDDLDKWSEALVKTNQHFIQEETVNFLENKGFCVKRNSEELLELYKNS